MGEACDLSAVEARRLIGARALSPVELMESCLSRIAAVDGAINAIIAMDEAMAMEGARAAEAAVMAGTPLGSLHGLPLALKDARDAKGLPTTHGSLLFKDHRPEGDDAGVARLRAAGAVPFAKTNMPEFGAGANTTNRLFGPTKNPFDTALTPAGSSGGAAAALATGMVPLAPGSDYGGSLRTPAAFCGVVGFRPSLGAVPHPMNTILSPFGVNGPMGRTVADTHLLYAAEAAHDPRDAFSRPRTVAPLAPADLATLRIALSEDLGAAPIAASVRRVFGTRTKGLGDHVGKVQETTPDFGPRIHDVFEVTRGVSFLAAHHEKLDASPELLDRNVTDNCTRALAYTAADVAWAQREQSALYRRMLAFFEDFDVILTPAASVPPFPHGTLFPDEIDGVAMATYMRWLAIAYMPTLAFCCAAVIPVGRDDAGLPFGLQIVGPPGADERVLGVAAALEALFAQDAATARPVPDMAALAA